MKAFADNKLNVTQDIDVVFNSLENIVWKGENACYQPFLVFTVFSKGLLLRSVKSCHCVV